MESKFKRIVLKLGGWCFSKTKEVFNPQSINFLVDEIVMAYKLCQQIIIVPGGGNIIRGRELVNQGLNQRTADQNGMLATCLNGLNLTALLENRGFEVRLMPTIEMLEIGEAYRPRRAISHLKKGYIVIIPCGLGMPNFTTDTAAIIRGIELDADVMLKATNVEGIYDCDPGVYNQAKFLPVLTYKGAKALNIQVFDSTAIVKAEDGNLPLIVFRMGAGNFEKVISGEPIGSLVGNKEVIAKLRPEHK